MPDEPIRALLDFAQELAYQAGKVTLAYFGTGIVPELKADQTPVTIADRQAEERLRAMITARFPEHAILGEEFGEVNPGARWRWILDPIDGTKSFVQGVPLYGVLVGLERDGEPVVGVCYLPALDEMVAAARGEGCTLNGRRASVSNVERVEDAVLLCSDGESFAAYGRQTAYDRLRRRARIVRTWGDCYGHVLVATGRAEIMLDPIMNVWDCAALLPIVQEAGGTFTDWNGAPTIHGGNAIATNGLLFEAVMAAIKP
ncbi:histidinol-phosphatase [Kallotenue papyrolyticum]|uniref:histidinol-phosphatase n=1 Tax=Kallotenue papyrolyticum TaxID=1325125 RepID=UPI000478550F|nr:histidinol-phosphatase [Kallotenue papyrolyticum]